MSQMAAMTLPVSEETPLGSPARGVLPAKKTDSDHRLLAATLEGDEDAFAELVGRYKNSLTNYLYRMLDDYEGAVDLAQETFVRVYQAAERYHAGYAFSTYLYRIATNLAISELRKRKRWRMLSLSNWFAADEEETEDWQLPDAKPLPDAVAAATERNAAIAKAIRSLPEKYRAPLILRDVEGHSYDAIAGILETNEGTVKSRISRARGLLRDKLQAYL
jgi:RNA polymerase sigma-70 factor (ECF subfamily)